MGRSTSIWTGLEKVDHSAGTMQWRDGTPFDPSTVNEGVVSFDRDAETKVIMNWHTRVWFDIYESYPHVMTLCQALVSD